MNLLLSTNSSFKIQHSLLNITGSKSETNRLLLLQAIFPNIILENTSNSDDSEVMQQALKSNQKLIDVHHAGTAMRFLTAFFAVKDKSNVTLTGSKRMTERPIKILVEALQQLGSKISYKNEVGFPPIEIKGQKITANKVNISANVSSQYISALLLIAPQLENGIELTLEGKITSIPYIKMTLALLNEIGVETSFENNTIIVKPLKTIIQKKKLIVESDWSSASYFFSLVALSNEASISLTSYKETSLQGDSELITIYKELGVSSSFENNRLVLKKIPNFNLKTVQFDLNKTPDIAQTIAVSCFGLGIGCHLTGLHTLKIKETDRLKALETELSKLGAKILVTNDSLTLEATSHIKQNIKIATYNDHRMAMAFAPLGIKVPIEIENAEVVSKSYPNFWEDLKTIGFQIKTA